MAAVAGVGYDEGRQMLSVRASGARDVAGREAEGTACEDSSILYTEVSETISAYNALTGEWVGMLCDAIDHAHQQVIGLGGMKDSAFLREVGSSLVVGTIGTLPGMAGITPILNRWLAGQPSSAVLADLVSGAGASGHNGEIISNLALSTRAFEMKSSISVNRSNEIRALKKLQSYLRRNPSKCTPAVLDSAEALFDSVPIMSHGVATALSRAFEAELWRQWIALKVTRVRHTGASGQFYSEDMQGISAETLKYLETEFPQIDVRKTAVNVREDTTSDTGFGGLANR
jgi:hypothetical protein